MWQVPHKKLGIKYLIDERKKKDLIGPGPVTKNSIYIARVQSNGS